MEERTEYFGAIQLCALFFTGLGFFLTGGGAECTKRAVTIYSNHNMQGVFTLHEVSLYLV